MHDCAKVHDIFAGNLLLSVHGLAQHAWPATLFFKSLATELSGLASLILDLPQTT